MKQSIQRAALHMQPGTRAERPPPTPVPPSPPVSLSLPFSTSLPHTEPPPSSQPNITPPPPLRLRVCSNQNKNITTTGLVFLRFDCCGWSLQVRVSPVVSSPPLPLRSWTTCDYCRRRSLAALIAIPRLFLTTCNDEGVTMCDKRGERPICAAACDVNECRNVCVWFHDISKPRGCLWTWTVNANVPQANTSLVADPSRTQFKLISPIW